MTSLRPVAADALRAVVQQGILRFLEVGPGTDPVYAADIGRQLGYRDEELGAVPTGANLGAGCGNPMAIAALAPGEIVVDLGSGAGLDAFLAARQVGPGGRVIGVDMVDAMIRQAREHARRAGIGNVEFRHGLIERLPVDDASVDVVISNCAINFSPEKARAFAEAYRVLRPDGRIMLTDVVLERPLPPAVVARADALLGCLGAASVRADYLAALGCAGFRAVRVVQERPLLETVDFEDPRMQQAVARLGIVDADAATFVAAVSTLHVFALK